MKFNAINYNKEELFDFVQVMLNEINVMHSVFEKFPYIQIVMIHGVSINIDKLGNTDCSILMDLMKRDLQAYMKSRMVKKYYLM